MPTHGGKRPGAGRRKGSLTKRTQEIVAKAAEGGLLPLEYMLATLRDPNQPHDERFKAAVNAAPYLHPKLATVQHQGDADNPLGILITTGVPNAAADDTDDRPQAH